jgi:hypothetical protein
MKRRKQSGDKSPHSIPELVPPHAAVLVFQRNPNNVILSLFDYA